MVLTDHKHHDRHHHDQIDAQRDERCNQHGVPAVPAGGGHAGGATRRAPAPMTPLSGPMTRLNGWIMVKAALFYTNGT